MDNKILVITGATGLIGSALIDLLANDNKIYAIVKPYSLNLKRIVNKKNVVIVEQDINDVEKLSAIINDKVDYFFHFAWVGVFGSERNDVSMQLKNIENTLKAIKVAKKLGCNKFIGAGSQAEVGISTEKIGSNNIENPITPYGIAKNSAGKLGAILAQQLGINFNWCRILSVYGKNDSNNTLVSSLIAKLKAGESCDLTDGEQTWDYINATDAARAISIIALKGVTGKTYPIGSGEPKKLKEFINIIYKLVGNHKASLNFGKIPTNENSVRFLCADLQSLNTDFQFNAQISFEEGIKMILSNYI